MLSGKDIPRGRIARDLWGALPSPVRREVIREAGGGRSFADPQIAAIAVGWAWEVLGRPEARRQVGLARQISGIILSTPVGAGDVTNSDIYDGETWHDENPVVRRAARNIESANPVRITGGEPAGGSVTSSKAPGRNVRPVPQPLYWILLGVAAALILFAIEVPRHRLEYLVIGIGSGVLAVYELGRARLSRWRRR